MAECRICLDTVSRDDLISPCNCDGSVKYVHKGCLHKWIKAKNRGSFSRSRVDGPMRIYCEICNYEFVGRSD